MKIEILFFRGCPRLAPTMERLTAVLHQEGLPARPVCIEVTDAAADVLGFIGSPTIRVNGIDIEPGLGTATGTGFACRLYPGGLPSEELIRSALREAARE